jgi:predicted RNase H-like HicB family nuclease
MHVKTLQIVVWQEGKYFVSQCLDVDVSSFGETKDEAVANLHEALDLYFEDADPESVSNIMNPEILPISLKYA